MNDKYLEDNNFAKIEPFEKYTKQYDLWFDKNNTIYKSEILAIKQLLPIKGNGVEIGIGSGRFALPFKIKEGIEPSDKMRKLAKKRGINVIKGVAENLSYFDNSFDFVLMVTTICFLDNIQKAFNEVHRVLKKHGFFIIGLIDKDSLIGKIYQKNKADSPFYNIATFYSVKEVVHYLDITGFKDYSFRQTIFNPLEEIKNIEPVEKGYGKGSFVVIKANK